MVRAPRAVEPRKRPRQERSQEMVERILASAQLVMKESGQDGLTTIAIAQREGLSVGSLYQYFPNKEAIVLELARRWLAAFRAALAETRAADPPSDLAGFERILHGFFATVARIYRENVDLLPVLEAMQANPELRRIDAEHDAAIVEAMAGWFAQINPSLDPAAAHRLGLIMLEAGHPCFVTAATREPAVGTALLGDLERMVLALLRPYLGLG
jgi:AcrR family transcriptional regulator